MMRLDDLVKLIKMRLRLKNILTVVVFFGIWKIFILVVRDVHTTKNKKGGVQLRLQEDDNVDSLDLKLDKYESADRILHSKKNSYKEYKEINEEYNDEVFISDDEQKNKDLNEVLTKTEEEFVNIPLHQNFPDSGIINNLVAVNAPKAKYARKRADNLVLEDGEGIDQLIEGPGQDKANLQYCEPSQGFPYVYIALYKFIAPSWRNNA
ncbi:uncharacterized protein LOC111709368 isoform X2 [Eurytemora carolleeae]|uniref:uncharacterized protein LOC111709368 isoform X2 n=1 Tax=Eurytemora carolleeae TaxID=1294199 RepID=UPI000C777AB5|nr:uncharacterized protein LOC111709368 isoform X2 [Eurytemora carolleeae]|eukprot:XP_023338787.1 uncharacterized protein LOC111709368 isoform X2 [Eurytemora affinis]